MDFQWLNDSRTSNKPDEITPPRSPRLPAPSKVTRICGNLTTSHWLKVRTLTEGCGRVQVAGGGRIGRCRCWVKNGTRAEQILTSVLPSTADIRRRGGHVRKVPNTRHDCEDRDFRLLLNGEPFQLGQTRGIGFVFLS